MRQFTRAFLFCGLVAFLSPAAAAAQPMTGSFDELSRLLRPGEVVQVIDVSGGLTWGRVRSLSEDALILDEMERAPDREATLTTGRQRVFTQDEIATMLYSDSSGKAGPPVYSTSWQGVQALTPGVEVMIVLKNGDRRSYRFAEAAADAVRVSTSEGREQIIAKSEIRRMSRRGVDDSTGNGLAIGALAGAGTMFAITAAMYAACDAGCDAPAPGPMFSASMAFGAGLGAAAGWIIDKLHKGTRQIYPIAPSRPAIGLTPVVTSRARGLVVGIAF